MKKLTKPVVLFVTGWAVFGAACTSEEKEPMTAASYCEERAEIECQKLNVACTLTPAATETCKTVRSQECVQETMAVSRVPGRVLKEANAKKCLEETNKVFSALMPAAVWTALRQVCGRVIEGAVQENQACTADLDCSGGLICDKGVCGTSKMVANGAPCSNPGEMCGTGQFCQRQPTTFWACVPRLAQGTACDATSKCLESLRCGETNMCVPARAASESCVSDAECAAPLVCDPVQRKCAAMVNLSFQCVTFTAGTSGDAGSGG